MSSYPLQNPQKKKSVSPLKNMYLENRITSFHKKHSPVFFQSLPCGYSNEAHPGGVGLPHLVLKRSRVRKSAERALLSPHPAGAPAKSTFSRKPHQNSFKRPIYFNSRPSTGMNPTDSEVTINAKRSV